MPENNGDRGFFKGLAMLASMGIAMVVSTFIGLIIGIYLDKYFDTKPWLTIIFLVFFAEVEAKGQPTAILATNTSSLKIADIGARMKDPSRLIGLHFFNPVPQMQLVELVTGAATNPEWAKKGAAFARQIDKLPLPVKDAPGFLVNRVLGPYMANAFRMLDGA